MKFSDYRYERPVLEEISRSFKQALQRFKEAKRVEEQNDAIKEINEIRKTFSTMENLCFIRHSIDTTDEFYKREQDFFDETAPVVQEYVSMYYKELVSSKFRTELENHWGKQLFRLADIQLKTFSKDIVPLLQKENKRSTEYSKLVASAKIPFADEEYTLAQLRPFIEDQDRDIRRKAIEASFQFFAERENEFDHIFDDLVKTRTEIAQKLGYKNFVELGYDRMNRVDYNPEMVGVFRKQVEDMIVPLTIKLKERQKKRIGFDPLKYYDEAYQFPTGNPMPKGSPEWIIEKGQGMYKELSQETDLFFRYMVEHELMDLIAKKGKQSGGYCTYIENYHSPFIFSNFNGTSGDLHVLTHEVGHAFQVYCSRHYDIPEYRFPGYEAAEIHSMSMEFFTWPWMKQFFQEDTDKYLFSHLSSALLFLPYGVSVDEFQHWVYEHPQATVDERKAAWRSIEKKYSPYKDYDGFDYLERGGLWQKQSHIYQAPFYYIDYTLAQICAFQFWVMINDNREQAWTKYINLCKLGGSKSFLELIEAASLRSPFEEGCLEEVVKHIDRWLDSVDDTVL
ncbi:M3 family oligoendopeptidase [Desmospora profundinema]|uniref:M3 family oligoendopeptidase n=1 Tax=Desmospora profundinema TaxID=1571184 RepID=A0ABU1IIS9_9BACL|nr:M3 family oligoendopeptidase [Desmospora profundinema]MDR6224668.1 M3 family oligoendopeptidase [Desmospora profundinema]